MLNFLFSDSLGAQASHPIDSTLRNLPDLGWFDLFSRARVDAAYRYV